MALVLKDRVLETTSTTGTGTLTLSGAVTGYQSFSVIGDGNTTYYAIVSGNDWEVGVGTYTSSGTTLSRDTVLESSAGGTTKISVASGAQVFCTYAAEKAVNLDASGNVTPLGTIASGTWQGTAIGTGYGGTGATTAPAANANLTGYTATATAAGTTTLTNTSTYYQLFTGTNTQTVELPVTSTLTTGWTFHIVNNSTGNLTVNSSGGNLVITVLPGTTVMATCIGTTLTTAADWEAGYTDFSTATGTGSVVLATSPTLSGPTINDGYTEEVYAVVDAAGVALSPTNGSIQTWTLGASRTPTEGTWAAGQSMTLMIDDGTAYTVTWTTLAVTWETDGGNAPTLATSGFTTIVLWKVGTTIYGARVGNN